jgi:hypothetical protein
MIGIFRLGIEMSKFNHPFDLYKRVFKSRNYSSKLGLDASWTRGLGELGIKLGASSVL